MATITTMFAYGGFCLGWYDIETANKIAVSGIIGSGAGIAATSLIMSVAIAYGTAGTGTAISTLTGVAATNAALAYIGGGTLAAGGGGMAAGMLILTSTTFIVGAAVTGAALFAWQRYDAYKEKLRTEMTINWLKERFAKN
jgi:hypothetical protein